MAHKYGAEYRRQRAAILAGQPACVWCGAKATTADHVPPISAFPPGGWEGRLLPACRKCNYGNRAAAALRVKPCDEPATVAGGRRAGAF